jgi:DNA-binding CsgD family transcriptional regulator
MKGFEGLVGRIYEAAAEPDVWPSVLHDIGGSVDAVAGALLAAHSDRWVGWRCSTGTPSGIDEYLRSDAPTRSQVTTRLVQANRAGFVPDQALLAEAAWLADPLMTEYATAAGLHHAAATAIHLPTGDLVVVHLHRRTGLPAFDAGELARLDVFRPHLARAAMLAVRWRLERLRAAAEALALVGLPAAMVDLNGRVLVANKLLEDMSSWTVWLPGDRIALLDTAANTLLRRAVSELRDPVAPSVRSIPIKATATTDAAVAHVVPATGRARDLFNGAFGVLVITPVSASSAPAAGILQALFDLTPSEVRVAQGIAEGLSLDQMAARHSVTIETVRAQAKAVFAKTGTNRQAQVAALLVGLPKMPVG